MNNKILFKWHSWAALIAFIPLVVICVTGSILVFKSEIDTLLMPQSVSIKQQEYNQLTQRYAIDQLYKQLSESEPEFVIASWEIFDDKKTADRVYWLKKATNDWYISHLNPYEGIILSEPVPLTHYLTDLILTIHYTFLLQDIGIFFSFLAAIILLVIGISGLLLYRNFWKAFFTFRHQARKVIFFSDIHKMFGFIASPILLILGLTGAYFSFVELYHDYIEHAGEADYFIQSPLHNTQLPIQQLLVDSQQQINDFQPTYIIFPYEPDLEIVIYGAVSDVNFLTSVYASTVTYDAETGEFIASTDARQLSFIWRLLDSFRSLHFGDFAGLLSKIVWAVLGFMPVILSFTGIYLWWKRRPQRQRAKFKKIAKSIS